MDLRRSQEGKTRVQNHELSSAATAAINRSKRDTLDICLGLFPVHVQKCMVNEREYRSIYLLKIFKVLVLCYPEISKRYTDQQAV